MDVKDFYFDLPEELIAQDPLKDRSSSRLLVLDRDTGEVQHRVFRDIVEYLRLKSCFLSAGKTISGKHWSARARSAGRGLSLSLGKAC